MAGRSTREMSPGGASLVFYFSGDCAFRAMCLSLRALCIGGRRLFVLVFAADYAEQREADQRCQKGQADQCGRGRRSRGEIKDGHHHRQREKDFQKFGHWMGGLLFRRACKTAPVHLLLCSLVGRATRFPVNLSTGSLVYLFTRLTFFRARRGESWPTLRPRASVRSPRG